MTATEDRRGTSAHSPDLDWSQVRETVLMLELAVGQIESALKEGNSSVEVLTDSFTSMAGYMRMMGSALEQLPDTPATAQLKESLIGHAGEVAGRVQRSIVAFQFYDKLSQRLAHVSHSLQALGTLVTDQRKLYNPFEWVALQEKIRAVAPFACLRTIRRRRPCPSSRPCRFRGPRAPARPASPR